MQPQRPWEAAKEIWFKANQQFKGRPEEYYTNTKMISTHQRWIYKGSRCNLIANPYRKDGWLQVNSFKWFKRSKKWLYRGTQTTLKDKLCIYQSEATKNSEFDRSNTI